MYQSIVKRLEPRRHGVLALTLVTALGLVPLAQAQAPAAPRGPMSFNALDLNHDGRVSADEFGQHRAERIAARAAQGRLLRNASGAPSFAAWDGDHDGYLDANELRRGQQARLAGRGPGRPWRSCQWGN